VNHLLISSFSLNTATAALALSSKAYAETNALFPHHRELDEASTYGVDSHRAR
jgi:hypothetical protein